MSTPQGPDGIGTPSAGHPAFTPPPAAPQPPTGWTPPPSATAPQGWAPPSPESRFPVAPPPTGRGPAHPRRRRRVALAAVLAAALLVVGVLSVLPLLPITPAPRADAPPSLVTAPPNAAPTAAGTATAGGDLGRPVAFTGQAGAGAITVTGAVWTDAGDLAAPPGERYLVLDVTVTCERGTIAVNPVLLVLSSGSTAQLPGFGAALDRPLGSRFLSAGDQVSGQVGYDLPAGEARLVLVDEALKELAGIRIPAP